MSRFDRPGPDGYTRHTIYRRGDRISPAALPDVEFAVDDLLPPAVEPASDAPAAGEREEAPGAES